MKKFTKWILNPWLWLVFVSVLVLLGTVLMWPKGHLNLKEIANQKDLRLLLQLHQDVANIENWQPHFAEPEQIQLLADRICSNSQEDLRSFIQYFSNDMDPKVREALNFQNILIRELIKYKKMPPLSRLRKKGKDECVQKLQEICGKIVAEKRHYAISRLLFQEKPKDGSEPTAAQTRVIRIQNVFWKNDLRYCPRVRKGWFGTSWEAQNRWVTEFHQAVKSHVVPLLDWYTENEKYRSIFPVVRKTDKNADPALVLRLAAPRDGFRPEFIRDGWRVRGNYTLFLVSSQKNGVSEEINTGIDSCRIQLIPNAKTFPKNTLAPTRLARTVYSNSGKELQIGEGVTVYSTCEVSRFLRQLGIPKGFSIRVLKVSSDALFEEVVITYQLEHSDLPGWNSSQFQLKFGNKNCERSELEQSVADNVKTCANEVWKHISSTMTTLRLFPCEVPEANADLTATVLLKPADLSASFRLWLDDQFQFQFQDSSTEQHYETILNHIFQQNSELKQFKGLARIDTLKFGKKIEGRGVISSCAFEKSDDISAKNIEFQFWISADGKVDTNCKTVLDRSKQTVRTDFPVPDSMTPEALRNMMNDFLSKNFPRLAPSLNFRVTKGSANQLCCEMDMQAADYPRLPLGTWIFENEEQIQKCVLKAMEWNPDAAEEAGGIAPAVRAHWNLFTHPCYGPIRAEITEWIPTSDEMPLTIRNTFYPVKSDTGISWQEPLCLTEGGQWMERDFEQVVAQIKPKWDMICSITNLLLSEVAESGLHVLPEMEEEWIQMKPLKFSMAASWSRPLGFPIHIGVGHVRISATELELPGRYALGVEHTFWLPFAGVSDPRLDLDFEKHRYAAGLSLTPPLEALRREIPEEGFDLEEYESPEMSEEERQRLFASEGDEEDEEDTDYVEEDSDEEYDDDEDNDDSENPWEDWICMDLNGSVGTVQKELQLGGALLLRSSESAAANIALAPSRVEGNLSTRTLHYSKALGGKIPVHFDGNVELSSKKSEFEAVTNLCGFTGGGKLGVRTEDKAIYDVGVTVAIPAIPVQGLLSGSMAHDFKTWSGEASGIAIHPFANFLGSLKYSLQVWKVPVQGMGSKLRFEWVTPSGRRVSFEKEFPDAQSLDENALREEILREIELLEQEEDPQYSGPRTGEVPLNPEEMKQLAQIGEKYPKFQHQDPPVQKVNPANPKDVQKALDALASQAEQAQKLLQEMGRSETAEKKPVHIHGNIDWYEESGQLVVRDVPENKELFRVSKSSAGFNLDENPEHFQGRLHYDEETGTGIAACIDPESFRIGTPMFRLISFDSPRSVKNVEKILPGNWDNRYELIRPFFPNSLKIVDESGVIMSEEAFMKELLALDAASMVLLKEAVGNEISGQFRYDDFVGFDNVTDQISTAYCLTEENKHRFFLIPWQMVTDPKIRKQIFKNLCDPAVRAQFSDLSIVFTFEEHDGELAILTYGVNRDQPESRHLYFFKPGKKVERTEFSTYFALTRTSRIPQTFTWLLHQYVTEAVPIRTEQTKIFLGDAGAGIVFHDPEKNLKRFYLISELNLESPEHPAACLGFETWKDWNSESIRFLPHSLQRREVREKIPFLELAPVAVTLWNREAKEDPEHWLASPMGLLISLAEKFEKENSAK